MPEWFTLVCVTCIVTASLTFLLLKIALPIQVLIRKRQVKIQEEKERRKLYIRLLQIKNSRRRRGRVKPKR
jgi:hypothetical protein